MHSVQKTLFSSIIYLNCREQPSDGNSTFHNIRCLNLVVEKLDRSTMDDVWHRQVLAMCQMWNGRRTVAIDRVMRRRLH